MKILYLTPKVNNEGGVAKSLSVKTNYFIENFNYSITVITQNDGNCPLFHHYNSKIKWDDITLKGNIIRRFFSYKNAINAKIEVVNPDVLVVSDNGLKGYLVPLLVKKRIPTVFECHGSIWVEDKKTPKWITFLKSKYKLVLASFFTQFVVLSEESRREWMLGNCVIIPNSIAVDVTKKAALEAKKVIAVARHSYEKGIDRLLLIWREVQKIKPDWHLEIYGDFSQNNENIILANQLEINQTVHFFEPTNHLEEKYLAASILVMTSRTEGLPMAILEANSYGLPVVAYDCPIGPRAIIQENETGFLIEDHNSSLFVDQLIMLMNQIELRKKMGEKAQKKMQFFNHQNIMEKWHELFNRLMVD
jgi:glycosyltransferase involved in cell wall biosynthesis